MCPIRLGSAAACRPAGLTLICVSACVHPSIHSPVPPARPRSRCLALTAPLYLDAGSINDGSDGAVTPHRERSPRRETHICERRGGTGGVANDSQMRGMHQNSGHPEGMSMRRNLHQEEEQEERMRGRTRGKGRNIEGTRIEGRRCGGGFRGRET